MRQAQEARPRWPAGQVLAYHLMTWGFILGEVIRRVTGQPPPSQLAAGLLRPGASWVWKRRRVRQAVIPAAGISTTARDLARFYQMLLDGGRLDSTSIVSPDTIARRLPGPGRRVRVPDQPA